MYSDDIAISVRDVQKSYRLFGHPGDRIKQFFSFGIKNYHTKYDALRNVSFDVRKGETVGIIGRNGSGKSTLLQLICGILKPTSGTVHTNGRISALLELGAGFNPEFTGRENIYFQGILMGFSRAEMDARFDEIVDFADIGEFLDQPVRTYSSGMFVRLAFAVAVSVVPDILVVDEALAVGDAAFQAKCLRRIDGIRRRGGTVLIVTHVVEQVAHHCDRAILLDHGRVRADGDVVSTLQQYVQCLESAGCEESLEDEGPIVDQGPGDAFSDHPAYLSTERRWGDRRATIETIRFVQNGLIDPDIFYPAVSVEARLCIRFHFNVERPIYGLAIKSMDGAMLLSTNSRELLGSAGLQAQKAGDRVNVCFKFEPMLDSGDYALSVGVASESGVGVQPHDRRYDSIRLRVGMPSRGDGAASMRPTFEMCS